MSSRRDSDAAGLAVGLALVALFFAVILAWKVLVLLCAAFAKQPANPLLWSLLGASLLLTLVACAAQGDPAAVTIAGFSWTALLVVAGIIARQAGDSAGEPLGIGTALHDQWWD